MPERTHRRSPPGTLDERPLEQPSWTYSDMLEEEELETEDHLDDNQGLEVLEQSPVTGDDLDDELDTQEEDEAALFDLSLDHEYVTAGVEPDIRIIESANSPSGYMYYLFTARLVHYGLSSYQEMYSKFLEKHEFLDKTARFFIEHFREWLDHLGSPEEHKYIPAVSQKQIYKNWGSDSDISTKASELFNHLHIALPGGRIILLKNYLSQAKQEGPSTYSILRETGFLVKSNPGISAAELNKQLTARIRSWNEKWAAWEITDQQAGEYLKKLISQV